MKQNDKYDMTALVYEHHWNEPNHHTYTAPTQEHLLSVLELADLFRVHVRTAQRWTKQKKIPYLRVGAVIRYRKDEVLQFAEKDYVTR